MPNKISVLVAARPNSKYLAKFLTGLIAKTCFLTADKIEVLVMLNKSDTWNSDLVKAIEKLFGATFKFFYEDLELGRAGLHEYFNIMAKESDGDWLVYFCEDHYIIADDWDVLLRSEIEKRALNPAKAYVIVPVFDNAGTMNHIVSRGFLNTMDGKLGRHGWIDSYINGVLYRTFKESPSPRVIKNIDTPLFHDFTHDKPEPMSLEANAPQPNAKGKALPKFDTDEVKVLIQDDADKFKRAIERGL